MNKIIPIAIIDNTLNYEVEMKIFTVALSSAVEFCEIVGSGMVIDAVDRISTQSTLL